MIVGGVLRIASKTGVVVAVFEGAGRMVAVANEVGANVAVWEIMETGVGGVRCVPCLQAVSKNIPVNSPIAIRFIRISQKLTALSYSRLLFVTIRIGVPKNPYSSRI
jgi:hypothetical protein